LNLSKSTYILIPLLLLGGCKKATKPKPTVTPVINGNGNVTSITQTTTDSVNSNVVTVGDGSVTIRENTGTIHVGGDGLPSVTTDDDGSTVIMITGTGNTLNGKRVGPGKYDGDGNPIK